jgi:uncharacterized membrane protein YraQ (UPF0718 family)
MSETFREVFTSHHETFLAPKFSRLPAALGFLRDHHLTDPTDVFVRIYRSLVWILEIFTRFCFLFMSFIIGNGMSLLYSVERPGMRWCLPVETGPFHFF